MAGRKEQNDYPNALLPTSPKRSGAFWLIKGSLKMDIGAVVLVVEDDLFIRLAAVEMITSAGCEVLEASGADKALEILSSRDDVDLMFTDVGMPGTMDGLELAFVVHRRFPNIKIIIASGTLVNDAGRLPTGASFFPKPYNESEIISEMKKLLE